MKIFCRNITHLQIRRRNYVRGRKGRKEGRKEIEKERDNSYYVRKEKENFIYQRIKRNVRILNE